RRDLPRHAPAVAAPAALALFAAVADDGVPVAVGLGLVARADLEREGLGLPEGRAAVQADAVDAQHGEFDHDDIALLAIGIVRRRMLDAAHATVGKGFGVEPGGGFGIAVVPEADRGFGCGAGHGAC